VRFDLVVPVNNLIDRTGSFDSPFNLTVEPFDLPVSLMVFHPCDNMPDTMLIEELLERIMGEIPIPGRDELGSMVGQDLAGSSVFTESLGQDSDGVLGCRRIEYPLAGDQPG
jgi:hypothetical protein